MSRPGAPPDAAPPSPASPPAAPGAAPPSPAAPPAPPARGPGWSLGPFRVEGRLGKGGMGEVWQARHDRLGVAVAVKVLLPSVSELASKDDFREEVRAAAGLDHPHIVSVYDHGEVGGDAADASEGALGAGTPYLVMELAAGGTLYGLRGQLAWPALRATLLDLLEALAHAHARGVIHRDLKPGNVLLHGRPAAGGSGHVKLADFGLAHLGDRADGAARDATAGTPAYMAPEQFAGHWRDFGPWTDLYALGCLAATMAAGRAPLAGLDYAEARAVVLDGQPQAFEPVVPVPAGFAVWVRTLSARLPAERFACAADATRALLALGEPVAPDAATEVDVDAGPAEQTPAEGHGIGTRGARRIHDMPTLPAEPRPTIYPADAAELATVRALLDGPGLPGWIGPATRPAVVTGPMPDWRRPEDARPAAWLLDAGLGVYGLRALPVVGREAERDRLWAAFERVRATGLCEAVVLTGAAGVGKTRLAAWLQHRAAEAGLAQPMTAVHGDQEGAPEGLGTMLAAYFRCGGLVGDALLDRLGSQLGDDADAWEPLALAQVVAPSAVAAGATAAMLSVASRQRVIGRALARAAAARPVIALLDDAHASAATIAFVTAELTARVQRPARVLYVLTVQDEALAERPWERERLDALLALPGASRLGVGPLGGETWRALVRNLLGLEGRVAALVEEHAHGNPTFAVQLVGDWVQRGVLAAGPTGFRLRPGVRPELPDGLHGVWARRFDQALAGRPEADRIALEVGAALGRVVRIEEWLLACAEAGAPPTPGAVEALVARNLARAEGDTWSFAQAMVSASIERLARAAGRWEAHHRACAAALASAHPHEAPGLARRIAGHLGMAQDWLGSLRPLLVAAREALLTDAYPDAHTLLDRRESALVAAGVGFDTRWAEGWALRAEVFRQEGRYDEARVSARRAEDAARRAGDDAVLADALSSLGQAERQQGDFPAAEGHLLAALALYRRVGRDAGEVECLHGLGVIAQRTAQTDRAWSFGEEVRTLSARTGNAHGLARALSQLGDIARERGDADLAFAFQEQALVAYTRIGSRWGAGFVENSVGNLYVRRGHTEAAEAAYRRSLALFEAIDSPQTVIPLTNLGAMQLARGEVAGARATLESALPRLEALGWRAYIANTHVQLLVCAALQGDWAAWRRSLPVADALLTELQISDEDVAQDAARAGTVAAAAGELAGAHAAWAIARTQWERLGRADRVGEVDAWLRGAAAGGGTGV